MMPKLKTFNRHTIVELKSCAPSRPLSLTGPIEPSVECIERNNGMKEIGREIKTRIPVSLFPFLFFISIQGGW